MHASWRDINLDDRVFYIRENKEYGFRTKDRTNRTVPFAQSLADALVARKEQSKSALVFPNKSGKPMRHLIRILKKRALDTGLNCGHCENKAGESCVDKPVCVNWYLHRFRHTFAITHLRNGVDAATIQAWMGHEELATTNIYFTKIRNTSEATKATVDSSFRPEGGNANCEETRVRSRPGDWRGLDCGVIVHPSQALTHETAFDLLGSRIRARTEGPEGQSGRVPQRNDLDWTNRLDEQIVSDRKQSVYGSATGNRTRVLRLRISRPNP